MNKNNLGFTLAMLGFILAALCAVNMAVAFRCQKKVKALTSLNAEFQARTPNHAIDRATQVACFNAGTIAGQAVRLRPEGESEEQFIDRARSLYLDKYLKDAQLKIDKIPTPSNSYQFISKDGFPNQEGTPRNIGKRTMRPKPGYVWVSFEEGGHRWMVGAIKEHASADDDPGFVQTDFESDYSVRIQGTPTPVLFHNCCTTNIQILSNYTGTIQFGKFGTNFFTMKDIWAIYPK